MSKKYFEDADVIDQTFDEAKGQPDDDSKEKTINSNPYLKAITHATPKQMYDKIISYADRDKKGTWELLSSETSSVVGKGFLRTAKAADAFLKEMDVSTRRERLDDILNIVAETWGIIYWG